MSTVVFFHAHPDDEAIFTGGTIALLAARGVRTVVVIATAGEQGRHHGGDHSLADHRADETRQACAILGVERVEFLGLRRLGHRRAGRADATTTRSRSPTSTRPHSVLAAIISDEDADALVYYDEGGIYGHADHLAVHRVGRRAAELAGVGTVYESTVDREYLHFVETHLVGLAALSMHEALPTGVPTVLVSTTIAVGEAIGAKRAAIAAHASQIPGDSTVLGFDDDTFAGVYGYEWYVRTGPPAVLDDLAM